MLKRAVQRLGPWASAFQPANRNPHREVPEHLASWFSSQVTNGGTNWVFLGPPGVGKGTYASRVASALRLPHISTGDLVREEIANKTKLGAEMSSIVSQGHLLPEDMILKLLRCRLARDEAIGEPGFILDGFPRTLSQAEQLSEIAEIQLAVNLSLREEVLIQKCVGRRKCGKCGKNYNLATISLPEDGRWPAITMPPLPPPPECMEYMQQRADDKEEVVRRRLEVYKSEAAPVEQFYANMGVLLGFEITAGIPETLPVLLDVLKPHMQGLEPVEAAA